MGIQNNWKFQSIDFYHVALKSNIVHKIFTCYEEETGYSHVFNVIEYLSYLMIISISLIPEID